LGLVEFFVPATRSHGIHRVRVGRRDKARTLYLRANGVDVYTFYATFIKGIYDKPLPLPHGATVLDLGANIGTTAAHFALSGRDVHVIAVEPERDNAALLALNTDPAECTIHRAAISDRSGTGTLRTSGPTAHTLGESGDGPIQTVPTLSLDDLAKMHQPGRVALMKVDIEGAEASVFAQPVGLLDVTDAVAMEIHDADERDRLVRYFAGLGFMHELGRRVDFPDLFVRR
jgi:FkbM family methyltransferase